MKPPFQPQAGSSITLNVTTTTSSANIVSTGADVVAIANKGDAVAFVRYGLGAQTAVVATDMAILSGHSFLLSIVPNQTTTFAAITASGTATVYVTPGWGQ